MLAACEANTAESLQALESLCRTYWLPIYTYVRRQGHSTHDAEDLTQAFFARLLEKDYLRAADREKGRFRTFLLVALKRFLANEWDRSQAQKRGGGQVHVCFDTSTAEARYQLEASGTNSPESAFDRRWALALLDQTMTRLRSEFADAGKAGEFDQLKGLLTAEKSEIRYPELAISMGMSEGALRVAVHRLRKRFREIFQEEIAHTVTSREEIDSELRYLISVLAQ